MAFQKEVGVKAVNQDFKKYDQVNKAQTYALAESDDRDLYDEDYRIRTCDLDEFFRGGEAGKDRFAAELGRAMEEIGFSILINHGVDATLFPEAERRTIDFFESTPLDEKLKHRAARFGSVSQGYFPIKETSDIHPDLVEGWVFCRRAFALNGADFKESGFWPRPGFEPFFRRLVLQNEKLILPIMQSILRYLGCDPHLYDERLTGTNFGLRLNYYPPMTDADAASGAGRILGHEDVDMFTILPSPEIEGLQALKRTDDRWVRLVAPPDSIIINTGDYMQRLTNDILPSTTHRVVKPRDRALWGRPRVSVPMAVYLWENEIMEVLPGIENPKYPPVKAIAFHTHCTSKFYGDAYAVDE
jgi:isopenicillin N synthase-like dioxygenase